MVDTVYRANDGTEFKEYGDAIKHEHALEVVRIVLGATDVHLTNQEGMDLFEALDEWFRDYYDV